MMVAVAISAFVTMATKAFGLAGNFWLFGLLLILIVFGNEFFPTFCPRFIQWLDNLKFRNKLGISILSIVLSVLYPIAVSAFGVFGFAPKFSEFETRALSATLTTPIIGFAPLFVFALLRESRLMRHLRGDRGITGR